jgi:hypothetical protein
VPFPEATEQTDAAEFRLSAQQRFIAGSKTFGCPFWGKPKPWINCRVTFGPVPAHRCHVTQERLLQWLARAFEESSSSVGSHLDTIITMESTNALKLSQLPHRIDTVLQIRTGRIKPAFGETSGIFKSPRSTPMWINFIGCEGDEHVYEGHVGLDNALI